MKTVNVTARGGNGVHEFDGGPNERLLHAGLRQGIALPYECGTGTCGTCKAKLISGKVRDSWPSAPGAKSLRHDAGEFLLCQCVPMTECVIEVGRAIEKMEMGSFRPAYFRGTVKRASLLARDVVLLQIHIDRPLDFEAGQFMVVKPGGFPKGFSRGRARDWS